MKPEHAHEFTEALGQVFEGAVRLADVAVDLNVPEALGMTSTEWAERRLAGPVKLKRDERRAVVEANPAKSSRELGEALDVDHSTILEDRRNLAGGNPPPETTVEAQAGAGAGGNPPPEDRRLGFLMSSASDEWATPQDLFDELNTEFDFTLDVCATAENAKCKRYFSRDDDGLDQRWEGACWMNPPYGDEIALWVEKAAEEASRIVDGARVVVCLLPARVDTGWWWDYCRRGEVRFLRGRLRFGGAEAGAPFPSAVVIFGRPARVVWWER